MTKTATGPLTHDQAVFIRDALAKGWSALHLCTATGTIWRRLTRFEYPVQGDKRANETKATLMRTYPSEPMDTPLCDFVYNDDDSVPGFVYPRGYLKAHDFIVIPSAPLPLT